jgi:hypothetical protein
MTANSIAKPLNLGHQLFACEFMKVSVHDRVSYSGPLPLTGRGGSIDLVVIVFLPPSPALPAEGEGA